MKRWIQSATAPIPAKLMSTLEGAPRHYAFWLLKKYARIGAVLRREAPVPQFAVSLEERKAVVRLLRRLLRNALGHPPRVHLRRSFALDSSLYRCFLHEGHPYLAIASMIPKKRIVIPLQGFPVPTVAGNIRVVVDPLKRTVAVHVPVSVRVRVLANPTEPRVVGLDAGVTEVFVDSQGNFYGEGFGKILDRFTEETAQQGAARNRFHARAKTLAASKDPKHRRKAGRILRFNLGRKKLNSRTAKGQAEIQRYISEAFRKVLYGRPQGVVVEDMSGMRGRTKSRKLSRKVSRWMRAILKERTEFLANAGGSRVETVNPAYTSQECPQCGFVHQGNRKGDRFQCLHCHFTAHADTVGAMNVERRHTDSDLRERITLRMPKEKVKNILMERFQHRQASPPQPG